MKRDRVFRIRLLTRHFHQLQGLRLALIGMVYTVVFGSYLVASEPTQAGVLIAVGLSILLTLPGERWLRHYYDSTFGRQVPHARDQRALLAFVVVFSMMGSLLDPLLASGVMVGAYFLWVAIRDWPARRYYAGGAAAVAVAGAAHVIGNNESNFTTAMTFLLIGVVSVPIGFLDHRLLVTLVQESREAAADAAEVHSPDA